MRQAIITSEVCMHREMLHASLQDQLGFPGHYGRNLSALADCLSEAGEPLRITMRIDPSTLPAAMESYVLRLAQVCAREATANENVTLSIEHAR